MLLKRTQYLFFYFQDSQFLDIESLMQGLTKLSPIKQILAISILKGEEFPITSEELSLLYEIPSDKWIDSIELKHSPDVLLALARKGLVLINSNVEEFKLLREKDENLFRNQWNIYAALYHSLTKWRDIDVHLNVDLKSTQEVRATNDEEFKLFIKSFGKPPSHFHELKNVIHKYNLPIIEKKGELYQTLLRRKTTRAFDSSVPMNLEELTTLLYYVFGTHGYVPIFDDIVGLKRTSPSGGDLHPIEVYPLINNVQGIKSGLYHYNTKDHSLELLTPMSREEVEKWANEFTAGQSFSKWAHVLFIMTARFYRNFWKYRRHQKAYNVIFMDAAHLSQTLYLVATALELGAFITAAINSANIEDKLSLDGISEGAIAICGCGKPLGGKTSIEPDYLPYHPRAGELEASSRTNVF